MADVQTPNSGRKGSSPIEKMTNNNYEFRGHHFPKRPALDLTFSDLTYSATTWNKFRRGK